MSPSRVEPMESEPRGETASELLLAAALDIVQAEGVAGLTLRPLASKLAVTPSYLNGRFGTKADVVRHIIAAARQKSAAYRGAWTRRLGTFSQFGAAQAADVCEAMFDDIVLNFAPLYTLYLESFLARTWDDTLREALADWLEEERVFWNAVGGKFGIPAEVLNSDLFHSYVIDELAYSLCLTSNSAYRLMRKLTMNRLFDGFRAPVDVEGAGKLFFQVFSELDYDPSELRVVHGARLSGGWPERVMQAAAHLVTTRGVGAVTHRAVAALAEVKPTTLAYRFATQEDLVVGGLEYIIARLLTRLDEVDPSGPQPDSFGQDDANLNIGRATFAVALAAARMDRLRPCAADMRRRRGINLIKILDRQFEPELGLDASSAQAIAGGLTAFTITPPQETTSALERAAVAFRAAVDWARRARTDPEPPIASSSANFSYSRFPISSHE